MKSRNLSRRNLKRAYEFIQLASTLHSWCDIQQEDVIDLLVNYLHWCDKEGLDSEALLKTARSHYEIEALLNS